jgi:hypothetical protein
MADLTESHELLEKSPERLVVAKILVFFIPLLLNLNYIGERADWQLVR